MADERIIRGKDRIAQLQGLRGLAMIGIFLMHTQTFYSSEGFGEIGFIADAMGRGGVIVFFMLSGFLLTFKGKEIPNSTLRTRLKMCRTKFHKLWLLYVLTLIFAFFGYGRIPQTLVDWCYSIVSLPLCLTYMQDLIPHVGINISYNGPAWYISAMFIIWILAYTFPKSINEIKTWGVSKCLWAIMAIVTIQVIYKIGECHFPTHLIPINHPQVYMSWISYFSPFYNFGYFLMGCFIGRLSLLHNSQCLLWYSLGLIFPLAMFYIMGKTSYSAYSMPLITELFIGLLMLTIMIDKSILNKLLSLKPLVWFGNISASFFLIHGVVNYHLRYVEDIIAKPTLFFISFIISFVLSVLSEKYIMLKTDESVLQHIKKIA